MRRSALVLACVAFAVLFSCAWLGFVTQRTVAQAAPNKPNIVFILTDDMRKDDLKYMPKTRSLLGAGGMTFGNAYVSNPLCCPARATIMRGQYAHNTGIWKNGNANGPDAGLQAYRDRGLERDNVATRLSAAGYRTALVGKYINGRVENERYAPPGWDSWFQTRGGFYNYRVNDNGKLERYGNSVSSYQTDVLASRASRFIESSGKPFFLYVAPFAPHLPATPALRHGNAHNGLRSPRGPSYDEPIVSDKPPWIRRQAKLTASERVALDRVHEARAESLLSVDDLVSSVVSRLQATRQLDNTYIFFTSDNGWHQGEHRIRRGKARPYEESIRVPLLVRGPGIRAGSSTNDLVLNTDYLPTFTDLAGAKSPPYVDGRSLKPVLRGAEANWRKAILIEGRDTPEGGATPAYSGIRTASGKKYIQYVGGSKEYYDLQRDPHELYSRKSVPAWLSSDLKSLKGCRQAGCRAAENGN